jgi:DNA-binding SARP family transcriptional activator
MAASVELRVLGAFDVVVDGRPVIVRGGAAVVLAALAMAPGRPVSTATLAAYVWPDQPDLQVPGNVQTLVSRLRRAIGGDAVERVGTGYRLAVPEAAVDLWLFRQLVREATAATDPLAEAAALDDALRLWRGEPFADLLDGPLRERIAPGLVDEWFTAYVRRVDLDFERGDYAPHVAELSRLTGRYPLREVAWQRLVLALFRSGRRAEALETYQRAVRLIREELGLDPGTELRKMQQLLFTDAEEQPRRRAVPRQLPVSSRFFTGRTVELSTLDGLGTGVTAIVGAAGTGKTTLAVHWGHRTVDRFPDGQLYVNLRGFGPGKPLDPAVALETLLRSLGVPAGQIPAHLDAQTGLLRTLLAGQRTLLILDNAVDSEQVRPLLPGAGPLVLVTSRNQLRGLVGRDGARRLRLDPLTPPEAGALLERVVGPARTRAEPAAVTELTAAVGQLPLALMIVAEHAARQSAMRLADLATELRTDRHLDRLVTGDDSSGDIRAAFSWSYDALEEPAREVFRLLGLLPGGDFGVPVVAAVAGIPDERAGRLLDRLAALHLVEPTAYGRFTLHDLLRQYAAELVTDREPAIRRLIDWYVQTAVAAREALVGAGIDDYYLLPPSTAVRPLGFETYDEASRWYEMEADACVAVIELAVAAGQDRAAVTIAKAIWIFQYLSARWRQMRAANLAVLEPAKAAADVRAEAMASNNLSVALEKCGEPEASLTYALRALDCFRAIGQTRGETSVLINMAGTQNLLGRFAEALELLASALALAERHGYVLLQAGIAECASTAYSGLGRHTEAIDHGLRGVELYQKQAERGRLTGGLRNLARVYAAAGDTAAAVETYQQALEEAAHDNRSHFQAGIHVEAGQLLNRLGDRSAAVTHWRQAHRIYVEHDDPRAADVWGMIVG